MDSHRHFLAAGQPVRPALLALLMVLAAGRALAAEPAATTGRASYFRDVRPIFQAHCQGCHQPAKAMGEFVMTNFDGLAQRGRKRRAGDRAGQARREQSARRRSRPTTARPRCPRTRSRLTEDRDQAHPPVDRRRGQGRHAGVGARGDRHASIRRSTRRRRCSRRSTSRPTTRLLAVSGYHEVLLHKADGSELVGPAGRPVGADRVGRLFARRQVAGRHRRLARPVRRSADLGRRRRASSSYSLPVTYDTVYGVSWSADGTKIAFGCADNTLRAIDAATGKQVLFQGAHSDWVLDTVFSKDGTYLISVSRDRSMKLIEVATQRFVDNITSITPGALKGGLDAVDRHPTEGRAADRRRRRHAEDLPDAPHQGPQIGDDFNLIKAYEAVPGRIYDAHFNADGSRFAVGSSLDGTGEVRDLRDRQRQAAAQARRPTRRRLRRRLSAPAARSWPRPASTAWCG